MIETIFALASVQGRAGVAVIRISGPDAFQAAERLAGTRPPDRTAGLRWLCDPFTGERIDQALVLCFPGPASFTGEDTAEFQVHGSVAVWNAVRAALSDVPGLRLAQPGEFTRRALMNGRVDLAQVEGLGDLLAAETAAQRRQALGLLDGGLSRRAAGWRDRLVRALAWIEAAIDFADEELPPDITASVARLLDEVDAELRDELRGGRLAERVREGFEVALVGAPNVGKSTLLNALARRDAAITSATAGTTRDVIEVRMDLEGLPITLLDMAGLRTSEDELERIGIARARHRACKADLRVFLLADAGDLDKLGVACLPGDVVVLAKADLRDPTDAAAVSGLNGVGIGELLGCIAAELRTRVAGATTASHGRQLDAIASAAKSVERALHLVRDGDGRFELAAAELHAALRALDFLIGKVDVEAILEVIFQSFCLGK